MSTSKHIPALDGFRGLAVLAVFLLHYGGGAHAQNPLFRTFGYLCRVGWAGVSLFFVLSGFLITGILWDSHGEPGWRGRFYSRRVLRIFPLYYLTLFAVLVAAFYVREGLFCLSHLWVLALYLQNVPVLAGPGTANGSPLWTVHLWSLAVEEQFYLLWPLLLSRLTSLRQARLLCIAVFAFSTLTRLDIYLHGNQNLWVSVFDRSGELAFGGYLAICYRSPLWSRIQRLAPAIFVLALLGFIVLSHHAGELLLTNALQRFLGIFLMTFIGGSLLVLALTRAPLRRLFETRWLRWYGTISYGFYIVHVLYPFLFVRLATSLLPHGSRTAQLALSSLFALLLSTLAASLSFRFFETPFLNLRKRFRNPQPPAGHLVPATAIHID